MASPPSCIASEEPVVAVPMASLADGACQRFAKIEMHRVWTLSISIGEDQRRTVILKLHKRVAGYSSESGDSLQHA